MFHNGQLWFFSSSWFGNTPILWIYNNNKKQQKQKRKKERKTKGQPAEPLYNNKGVEGEGFGKLTSSSFFCLTNSVKSLMFLTRLLKGHSGPMSCKHMMHKLVYSHAQHTLTVMVTKPAGEVAEGLSSTNYPTLSNSSSIASFKSALKIHLFSSGLWTPCLCKHVHAVVCHCFHVGVCACVCVCVCVQLSKHACACACMCLGSDEKDVDLSVVVCLCN